MGSSFGRDGRGLVAALGGGAGTSAVRGREAV